MKFIPNAVTRVAASKSHVLVKHSPRILFVAGIVGFSASTVLACKATLKLDGLITDMEIESDQLANQGAAAVADPQRAYNEKDFKRDQTKLYVNHAARVCKLYAPAAVVGLLSVAALTKSHFILTKRNASLTLAYATLEKAFDDYRDRVKEKYGEDAEYEIRHAVVEETKVVDGKKTTVKRPTSPGLYARFYDEFAKNWQPDPEANRIFINNQMNWANDRLESRGHVFLNEVYDMLGLERTEIGQYVGWALNNPDGDGYIDFGVYDSPRAKDFINGHEPSVLLDFNVDGRITDFI